MASRSSGPRSLDTVAEPRSRKLLVEQPHRFSGGLKLLLLVFALVPVSACSQQSTYRDSCKASTAGTSEDCLDYSPLSSSGRSEQIRSYPGVPEPTGLVPSAIMPTVPTGADRQAFPYDPRSVAATLPEPWPSEAAAGAYYIDRHDPSATDFNNAFGYPDKPRATIPASARGPGTSYVEIHGSNKPYKQQSPEYLLGKNTISNAGRAEAPTVWQCIDGAWIGAKITIVGQHVVVDGCNFQNEDGNPSIPHVSVGPGAKFVTLRNSTFRGQGTPIKGGTGQIINIAGQPDREVEFVMIFNNVISGGGDWTRDHKKDIHAVRPLYWARYIWVLENDLSHVQGDLVQTGNSSNRSKDPAQRSHYIYIAGNHMHDAFENALDNKNSYHVILSSNNIHGFGNARTGTAVILSNNDEGRYTGYHWAIRNEIYDATGGAIRFSGDQDGQKTFAVGNYIHDVDDGIRFGGHSGYAENDEWAVGNLIKDCSNRAIAFPRGAGENLTIRRNVTIDCPLHVAGEQNFRHSEISYNLFLNSNGSRARVGLRDFDTQVENSTDGTVADIRIILNADDGVYSVFESLYGFSISPIEGE